MMMILQGALIFMTLCAACISSQPIGTDQHSNLLELKKGLRVAKGIMANEIRWSITDDIEKSYQLINNFLYMYDYWNEMSQQINAESSENEIGLKVIVKRTLQRACKMIIELAPKYNKLDCSDMEQLYRMKILASASVNIKHFWDILKKFQEQSQISCTEWKNKIMNSTSADVRNYIDTFSNC